MSCAIALLTWPHTESSYICTYLYTIILIPCRKDHVTVVILMVPNGQSEGWKTGRLETFLEVLPHMVSCAFSCFSSLIYMEREICGTTTAFQTLLMPLIPVPSHICQGLLPVVFGIVSAPTRYITKSYCSQARGKSIKLVSQVVGCPLRRRFKSCPASPNKVRWGRLWVGIRKTWPRKQFFSTVQS